MHGQQRTEQRWHPLYHSHQLLPGLLPWLLLLVLCGGACRLAVAWEQLSLLEPLQKDRG